MSAPITGRDAAHAHLLLPLERFLSIEGATDIVINRPGVVHVETHEGWSRYEAPELSYRALRSMAISTASTFGASFDSQCPEFAAAFPGGERVQFIGHPRTPRGTLLVTVRVPPRRRLALADLAAFGLFEHGGSSWMPQLVEAVRERRTIVISGGTGTGKTTLMRALASLIPLDERVLTIEDTPELDLPEHENLASLLYPPHDRAQAKDRMRTALRMRPDRILLAETRGGEAFQFVHAAMSGHPGGMTSVHANTAQGSIDVLAMLARQDDSGRGIEFADMLRLVRGAVDLVVVLERTPTGRRVIEMAAP